MMAELMGRETGYCRGLGGSMHIADLDLHILGANGIVGASMPLSCGAALAAKLRGEDTAVVAFFGDGASNQGVFHESLNLAAVWRLPVVFVCENNQYALTTSYRSTTSVERIADRAASYGMPGLRVDGNDVGEVYHVSREAIARARAGDGPTLIEALTYRWGQHSMRANLQDPRPDDEYSDWMARDPIKRLADTITSAGNGVAGRLASIDAEVEGELDRAVAFARAGAEPDTCAMDGAVYAPHLDGPPPPPPGDRELAFTQALNEALHQEMARDERVFLMGEDVGETGGIFSVSAGLMKEFGEGPGCAIPRSRRRRSSAAGWGRPSPRDAPGGRGPDLRLHRADHGHDGESGREVPVHAGGQEHGAAGGARVRREAGCGSRPSTARAWRRGSRTSRGWWWWRLRPPTTPRDCSCPRFATTTRWCSARRSSRT